MKDDIEEMRKAQIAAAKNRLAMNTCPWRDPLYQWAMMNSYTPPKPRTNPIGIPLIRIS